MANENLIHEIENLGLTLVQENEAEGEVCMANSREIRMEYRQTFTPTDLSDYVYAVTQSRTGWKKYQSLVSAGTFGVPCPKDQNTFWELVKLGREARKAF